VENFNNDFHHLNANNAPTKRQRPPAAGDKNSQNARQLEEGFRLWCEVRNWFMKNWDKWQNINVSDWCAENSIEKMAKED
jgi:hypothetical protein